MAVLSTSTKGRLSVKAAGAAIKSPRATTWAAKAVAPAAKAGLGYRRALAKRRARQRAERARRTARSVGYALFVQAPEAAQELGLVERPAPKRTAPRVAAGVLIGASAMYLLEPGAHGREHREKAFGLVS